MTHDLSCRVDESIDLALLWRGLCDGRFFVSGTYCADGRCFAWLEAGSGAAAVRPSHVLILERVFEGESQKAIACELSVSIGTVAGYCKQGLGVFMPPQWVSRAPIVVVMAALAARGVRLGYARCEGVSDDGRWLISVDTPGQTFRDRLSSSELEVARLAIEGESHDAVAKLRGTSVRTIANQLAAVFAKLGVSGRGELRARAVHEYAARRQTEVQMQTQAPRVAESMPALSLSA